MRIAIVNDLALAREVLRRLIRSVPNYVVAWTAENGEEAVAKAAQDPPDIILMDLIMPVLDGVQATRRIMAASPCPILLVTSTVSGNFNMVYQAMGYGGLDAVNTPTLAPDGKVKDGEGILARIAKLTRQQQSQTVAAPLLQSLAFGGERKVAALPIVAIGASTGGPDALSRVLQGLPQEFPAAVVIVQHIAADYATGLARWLQGSSRIPVKLVQNADELKPGMVHLAGTNDHLTLGTDQRFHYIADPVDNPYRPSVDVFFHSLAAWPRPGVAVLLTGMGNDGAQGLLRLRQLGWHTIAQDQASCVVYGMPKAAAEIRASVEVLPLDRISTAIAEQMPQFRG
jgi:two-component system response regulator WspF